MTVEEALQVDAHNDPSDVREQAIYVLLTEAAEQIRLGEIAKSQSFTLAAYKRLEAHSFMLRRVERTQSA